MNLRIALSLFLLTACQASYSASDDVQPPVDNGIGTSPSEPVSEASSAVGGEECWVRPCAVWTLHSDETEIDVTRHPDIEQWALPGGLSCVDALRISSVMYSGRSLVRYYP